MYIRSAYIDGSDVEAGGVRKEELKNLIQPPLDKRMNEKYTAYAAVYTDALINTGIVDYLSDAPNPSQGVPATEQWPRNLNSILFPFSAAMQPVRETCDSSFSLNRCSRSFSKGHEGRRLNIFMPGFMSMVETIPHWIPLQGFSRIMQNPDVLIPVADHLQVIVSTTHGNTIIVDCGGEEGGLVTAILA
ncbi:hypothetical protein EV702DRAFT_1200435 [Suillus placidus]|uniref:Uncharacterized protein n=1 Tax=Suillus placidus TaxID=48579 RepID=A0A9P7CZA0_9AGAM|nr:hypothetical protein EV702DRAFT_1200435 [Suillus placidus]